MSITFLHTADWQLGKPFQQFPDDVATRLGDARYDAIDRVASAAKAAGARHVLVAGDVFDHHKPPARIVDRMLARLAVHPDLVWHLLPGNHDPAEPGKVWDDLARRRPPDTVRCHTQALPFELAAGVVLIPAPLTARALSHDPTAFMDRIETPRGTIRIGMAHGSVRGFSSESEAAIPIDAARAGKARLDYLALGDWHGPVQINARTWYSGTHEPDSTKDNGPGQALVVTIAAPGREPQVTPVATKIYHWHSEAVFVSALADLDTLAEKVAGLPGQAARLVLKLALTGRVPLAEHGLIAERLERLGAGLAHLDADASAIEAAAGGEDLAALGTGSIAAVAQRLAAGAIEQPAAAQALRILARLVGQAGPLS